MVELMYYQKVKSPLHQTCFTGSLVLNINWEHPAITKHYDRLLVKLSNCLPPLIDLVRIDGRGPPALTETTPLRVHMSSSTKSLLHFL